MRPPPQPAANADRRNAVPAHARRLAVVLEILVLLAVILLRFSSLFHSPNDEQGATLIPQTLKLASRWGVVFALLVPPAGDQFWLVVVGELHQLSAQLSRSSTELADIRTRLNAGSMCLGRPVMPLPAHRPWPECNQMAVSESPAAFSVDATSQRLQQPQTTAADPAPGWWQSHRSWWCLW